MVSPYSLDDFVYQKRLKVLYIQKFCHIKVFEKNERRAYRELKTYIQNCQGESEKDVFCQKKVFEI